MALKPITVDRFGGLNVAVDPLELGWGAASDLLNVEFNRRGKALRVRDGYVKASSVAKTDDYYNVAGVGEGSFTGALLAARQSSTTLTIDEFTSTAASLTGLSLSSTRTATLASANHIVIQFVAFGDYVYITTQTRLSGGGADTLRKWNSSALADSVGKPVFIGVTPVSHRLVQGGIGDDPSGGTKTGASTVFFSDPDDGDTYGTDNWVDLDADDGEKITSIATLADDLYVFKQTKVYVFYGESVAADGSPEFNYRRVELPARVVSVFGHIEGRRVAEAPGAIYLSTLAGIYRITQGPRFELLTTPLSPLWTSLDGVAGRVFSDTGTGTSPDVGQVPPAIQFAAGRLIASYVDQDASENRQYVYDTVSGAWSRWDIDASVFSEIGVGKWHTSPPGNLAENIYFPIGGDVYVMAPSVDDDAGTDIAWSYTSGYQAPAGSNRVRVRGSSVWGSGTVTLQMLTLGGRAADVADVGGSVTLGAAPVVAEGKRRRSCRGVQFAYKLSGTGQASVSRLTHRFFPPGFDS